MLQAETSGARGVASATGVKRSRDANNDVLDRWAHPQTSPPSLKQLKIDPSRSGSEPKASNSKSSPGNNESTCGFPSKQVDLASTPSKRGAEVRLTAKQACLVAAPHSGGSKVMMEGGAWVKGNESDTGARVLASWGAGDTAEDGGREDDGSESDDNDSTRSPEDGHGDLDAWLHGTTDWWL